MVIVIILLAFIVEGFHDYYIWKSSDYGKYEYTKKWHIADFLFHTIVWGYVSYLNTNSILGCAFLLVTVGFSRLVILNTTLNILRGKKIHYFSSSSNPIDKILSKKPIISYFTIVGVAVFLWVVWIFNLFNFYN